MMARLTGDETTGVALLGEAEKADAGDAEIALQSGLALMDAGRLDESQVSLLRAATLDDGSAVAWGSLAEIALRQNEGSIALQHARRARDITPESLAYRVLEARALKRMGDAEAALVLLDELTPPERYEEGVLATVGECMGLLGRAAEAAIWHANASAAFPGDPEVAYQAALWAERAGDIDGAARFAERAAGFGHEKAATMLADLRAGQTEP
jgi:predicted Zn-dependent protease